LKRGGIASTRNIADADMRRCRLPAPGSALPKVKTARICEASEGIINTMAVEILLPKIGFSMQEGQIAEWMVADGAQVTEGQPLFSLEADKSTNEVEAPASGTLKIVGKTGETYEVGTVLGWIE
jgi:biotin carboxyl carrier protein